MILPVLLLAGITASGIPAHGEGRDQPLPAVAGQDDVPLSAVPLAVRYAVLASADADFYIEHGGPLRAIFGGSADPAALTLAYARRADPTRNSDELARHLEQSLGKDVVLQRFLNTGYYGRGAFGIGPAAHAYFGVTPDRLTAAQGAVLAAALSGLDPAVHPTAGKERWTQIVSAAAEREWLSAGLTYPETTVSGSPARPPAG